MNLSITYFKIREILRHPLSLLLIFFVPLGLTLIVGHMVEKGQKQLEIPIAIIDEDHSDFSRLLVDRISSQAKLHLYKVSGENAERMLLKNDVDSVFVIKKGFQKRLLTGQREEIIDVWTSPSSIAEGIVREVIASETARLTSDVKAADWVVKVFKNLDIHIDQSKTWNAAYHYTDSQWEPEPLMTIQYDQLYLEESGEDRKELGDSPYLRLWTFFTMLSCFLTSDWIIREKGVLFLRIQSTYHGLVSYLLQSTGALFLFHSFQTMLAFYIFGKINIIQMRPELLMLMIVYPFVCMALSVWSASFTKQIGSYYIVSFLFVIIIGILGGSFFPVQEFSSTLLKLSMFFPQNLLLSNDQVKIHTPLFVSGAIVLWMLAIRRLREKR
ncbi:ABC transporter permease [Neobacillus novalis]|uniref:ABC transporter permease n=1 Tax=Neobacillus novalis TaxID=220687 RepID=A0AA95MTI0_9BACI|nr:ABC transporter permease [Neobacillus novalis]WHY87503.1 ABC transporter permease [Neobacillus novalis]